MKKITWCVIYVIKVNYTSYSYTSYKSTWMSLQWKLIKYWMFRIDIVMLD